MLLVVVVPVTPCLARPPAVSTSRRTAVGLGLATLAAPVLRAGAEDEQEAPAAEKWVPATPMEAFMGPPPKKAAPRPRPATPVYPWDGVKDSLPPIAGVNKPAKGTFSDATKALGLPDFSSLGSYKPPAYKARSTEVRTAVASSGAAAPSVPSGVALPAIDGTLKKVLGSAAVLVAAAAPFFLPSSTPRTDVGATPAAGSTQQGDTPVQLDALPAWMSRLKKKKPPAPGVDEGRAELAEPKKTIVELAEPKQTIAELAELKKTIELSGAGTAQPPDATPTSLPGDGGS